MEKFKEILTAFWIDNWEDESIKLTDEFAIGFAEWVSYKYIYLDNKGWFATTYHLEMDIFKSGKELLEIYKKENNL